MASRVTYFWKLATYTFTLPLRVFGYRLSAGFWLRWTKDVVNRSPTACSDVTNGYIYEGLPSRRHIRLLELHPGFGDQPLRGTLRPVHLDSLVKYEALSYVWGDPSLGSTIDIGGRGCLSLTSNLTNAVHHLRHTRRPRMLWIDAICINQKDVVEKQMQVPLMAEIYSRCESVLVWLGMPMPQSQLGLEMLSYLANSEGQIGNDCAPWDCLTDNEVEAALRDILDRPYFRRVWVVQEAALARRVRMQIGHLFFQWSGGISARKFLARIKLAEVSPSWQQSVTLRDAVDFRPIRELLEQSLAAEAKRKGTVVVPSLLDLVHSIRHRQTTDLRDSIYGVMSLATPAEVAELVPDYSASWEDTYRRFYDVVYRQVLSDSNVTLEDMTQRRERRMRPTNA